MSFILFKSNKFPFALWRSQGNIKGKKMSIFTTITAQERKSKTKRKEENTLKLFLWTLIVYWRWMINMDNEI